MQSLVTPYFSNNPVFLRLLDDLAKFFNAIVKQKIKLRRKYAKNVVKSTKHEGHARDEEVLKALPTLQEIWEADLTADPMGKAHRAVLALVDSAIIGQEYMQKEENLKAAKTDPPGKAMVASRTPERPARGAKRARSSLQEITNAEVKPKRIKENVQALKMKQDENKKV